MSLLILLLGKVQHGKMKQKAKNVNFPIKDFLSKCDQMSKRLRISSHLLKKSFMENFIFSAERKFMSGKNII